MHALRVVALGLVLALAQLLLPTPYPANSFAQGARSTGLTLWVSAGDADPSILGQVLLRSIDDDAVIGAIEPEGVTGLNSVPVETGLYLDLSPRWAVEAIECEPGIVGTAGGRLADQVITHIRIVDPSAAVLSSCQLSLRYEPDPALSPIYGDANCDARLDVIDALVIAQFDAGVRTSVAGCPIASATEILSSNADLNGDGSVDIIDALQVAQCSAGVGAWCGPPPIWPIVQEHALAWPREIVDLEDGTILVNTSSHIERITPSGERSSFGDFSFGNGLHRTETGDIWATDSRGDNTVHLFDATGTELAIFGGPGDFACPNSIHVDDGEVFILEGDSDRLQVLGVDGAPLRSWGGTGSDPGQFDIDCGTASLVEHDDEVYVTDCRNQRVQVFDRDGTFVRAWPTYEAPEVWGGGCPSGITADASGRIYVADEYAWIRVYSPTGEHLETVWSAYDDWRYGGFAGGFISPNDARIEEIYSLHVNAAGTRLWASINRPPQRVLVFDRAEGQGN